MCLDRLLLGSNPSSGAIPELAKWQSLPGLPYSQALIKYLSGVKSTDTSLPTNEGPGFDSQPLIMGYG